MADLIERTYLSQFSEDTLGILVHAGGVLADADGNDVMATFRDASNADVFARPATRIEQGRYGVTLTSAETSVPGLYTLTFDYTVGGNPDTYTLQVEIGSASPAYDALSFEAKAVVEGVWLRFADLFDSALGGPHLQEYAQTHFGRGRIAQLLRVALGKLNTTAQPHGTFSVEQNDFPFARWGALLEQGLYIEAVKHLIRSYVEQPEVVLGTSVSRLDRRDYMNRWQTILDMETEDYKDALGIFKMEYMGLGNVSVLVSGGAFGNYGPTAYPGGMGQAAARGYFFARRVF